MSKAFKFISVTPLFVLLFNYTLAQNTNGGIATNPYPNGPVYDNGTLEGGNQQGVMEGPGLPGDGAGEDGTGNTDIPFDSGLSILISAGIGFALYRSKKDTEAKMAIMEEE